jgi:hypothetical protein
MRIAKTGKSHSVGENLLRAAIKDAKTMFSNKLLKDIHLIPLSNDRINDVAGDV